MNENNNDKKDENRHGKIWSTLAVILGVLAIFGDVLGEVIAFLIPVGLIAAVILISKKAEKKSRSEGREKPTEADFKEAAKESWSKVLTEVKKAADTDDCSDDHEHVDPSDYTSDDEKRIRQLKAMMQNGIIDREEYHIMMKKYGYE